jgi:hypothetical protein
MILETEYSTIQMGDIIAAVPPALMALDENGGTGLAVDADAMASPIQPKAVKNSRKKKINTTEIRFYNE